MLQLGPGSQRRVQVLATPGAGLHIIGLPLLLCLEFHEALHPFVIHRAVPVAVALKALLHTGGLITILRPTGRIVVYLIYYMVGLVRPEGREDIQTRGKGMTGIGLFVIHRTEHFGIGRITLRHVVNLVGTLRVGHLRGDAVTRLEEGLQPAVEPQELAVVGQVGHAGDIALDKQIGQVEGRDVVGLAHQKLQRFIDALAGVLLLLPKRVDEEGHHGCVLERALAFAAERTRL